MEADSDFADRLEIFFGEASDALCRVYARLQGPEAASGLQLCGRLTGPACLYAETLPAAFPFVDRGAGESLVAEAIVPEPCFWTPDMPHVYQAQVELRCDSQVLARAERPLGIRTLGAHGRKLIYDGKRWVLRGVYSREAPPTDLRRWRESDAAMIVRNPGDTLCMEASRIGVLIVAELDTAESREIRRLCRWPAVAVVALPNGSTADEGPRAHNLVSAQSFTREQPLACEPWAQIAICEAEHADDFAQRISACPRPVIAVRQAGKLSNVAEGRALCDRLQRDLAGRCDPAGYIV